jgi:WD40 repeat protein
MFGKLSLVLLLSLLFFPLATHAQECAPPPIVANAKSSNLFTPEQEMIFGELTIQNIAGEIRFIRDDRLVAYVNEIGDRIARHLPPTGLKFRFHLIELSEANAFNLPGGHVLLSRKLVAFSRNEDELAGVIAHELGHAVVRHGATDISEALRKVLNVTSLGDRRDIVEKYNLLIERARTRRLSRREGHENEQQLEADRIGVFAMAAAGYDPASFTAFFDRLTEAGGKTGGWFSDLFGRTRPEHKRLREMINATRQLSPACREGRSARATSDFLAWQAAVVSYRETDRREELPGLLWKRGLSPKLRSDVTHFAFSPDGKYLLAQDDTSVTVIGREPLGVLFQIPSEGAREASFTPDGLFIVFTTDGLRYEKWSVTARRPVEVREMVLRRDCWEHKLSPDGNYLACVDISTAANLFDTRTGQKIWEKKDFFQLSFYEYLSWLVGTGGRGGEERGSFFRIEFSPDNRYVMFSRTEKFRFRFKVDVLTVDESENAALALDLTTFKPATIGGELKKVSGRPYVFLDSGTVLGQPSWKVDDAGLFAFPSGKRLQRFQLSVRSIKRTANPDYVVVKPLANVKMGVFDLKKGVVASGMNKEDGTIWNNLMAFEAADGKLLIREVSYNEAEKKFDTKDIGTVEIPVGSISNPEAVEVSNNFDWLLFSSKTRGGLWDLRTGERKLYVRGFKGGLVGDDGASVSEFPGHNEAPHSLVLLNPIASSAEAVRDLPEKGARQHGRFVLLRSSLKEAPGKAEKKKDEKKGGRQDDKQGEKKAGNNLSFGPDFEGTDGSELSREVRFELKDFVTEKIVWSRDFQKEAPEYSFDAFSGRLIFFWRLGSDAGKAKLKEFPQLQAQAAALGNKADDYLVEVVDAFARDAATRAMLLETGKGSFDVGEGRSEGDWLVLKDSEGRLLVYSLKDGDLRQRFFGRHVAVNPKRNLIAVENFPGDISLYDLESGDRRGGFVISGNVAFLRFNFTGDRLFVLSNSQAAYAFDLGKALAPAAEAK